MTGIRMSNYMRRGEMRSISDRNRIKYHFDLIAKLYPKRNEDLSQVSPMFHSRLGMTYEMLGAVDGLKFLDVGCGPGLAAGYILQNGGKYFGIDLSKEMLKESCRTSDECASMQLAVGIMEHLPFPNASFDGGICLGVLEYVEDLELAIAELSRVMRDDSIVVLSMQNQYSIYRWWEHHVYFGFLFNALRKLRWRPIAEEPLEKLATIKDLRDILSHHHFVVTDTVYYNFNLWLMPLDRWFSNLSVITSKKLEFLSRSIMGFFLGADFLVKAHKVISEAETIATPFL